MRLIAAHRSPYGVCTFSDCVRVRELCLSLCTFLSKILSRTALVVTTSVSSMRLDRTTQFFCYRLPLGTDLLVLQGWVAHSVSKSRGTEKVPGFDSHKVPFAGD